MVHAENELRAANGRPLSEVTLAATAAGDLSAADLGVSAETLRAQAEIADHAGYTQLADNLFRAAELTAVSNEELLQMYELLRPGRATLSELVKLAKKLKDTYNAPRTARLVQEAASAYQTRGLLKRE
jgi:propanediol dehydratase small subunit